jgi:hypothetical protein
VPPASPPLSALQISALQISALQISAVQISALQISVLQHRTRWWCPDDLLVLSLRSRGVSWPTCAPTPAWSSAPTSWPASWALPTAPSAATCCAWPSRARSGAPDTRRPASRSPPNQSPPDRPDGRGIRRDHGTRSHTASACSVPGTLGPASPQEDPRPTARYRSPAWPTGCPTGSASRWPSTSPSRRCYQACRAPRCGTQSPRGECRTGGSAGTSGSRSPTRRRSSPPLRSPWSPRRPSRRLRTGPAAPLAPQVHAPRIR